MRKFRTAVVVVAWLTSVAAANPLTRKPPPPSYPVDALHDFSEAAVFEREGRLEKAQGAYRHANRLAETANAYYNLAAIALALDTPTDAIEELEHYLSLAPSASDRTAVEHLAAELKSALPPHTIAAYSTKYLDPRTVIVVDGVVVGSPPVTVRPGAGVHTVERISTTRYWRSDFRVTAGTGAQVDNLGSDEVAYNGSGNVIIDGLFRWGVSAESWKEGGTTFAAAKRFTLPVGHYQTRGPEAGDHHRLCTPIEFDVKAITEVTYVHLGVTENPDDDHLCATVKAVTVQRLLRGAP